MIKFIREHKILMILVLLFIFLISFYFIREYIASKDVYNESYLNGEDYVMVPKSYGVNEYSVTNITDEQMALIYLNDFKSYLYSNINYAYQLLNEDYRTLKFGTVDNFLNYIKSTNLNSNIDRYSINDTKDVYTIYTENNMKYIFKAKSVMEYEVYLDDYTVEIR